MGRYKKYKHTKECKEAIKEMQKSIPDFAHCGISGKGYVELICRGCPWVRDMQKEKTT